MVRGAAPAGKDHWLRFVGARPPNSSLPQPERLTASGALSAGYHAPFARSCDLPPPTVCRRHASCQWAPGIRAAVWSSLSLSCVGVGPRWSVQRQEWPWGAPSAKLK